MSAARRLRICVQLRGRMSLVNAVWHWLRKEIRQYRRNCHVTYDQPVQGAKGILGTVLGWSLFRIVDNAEKIVQEL